MGVVDSMVASEMSESDRVTRGDSLDALMLSSLFGPFHLRRR